MILTFSVQNQIITRTDDNEVVSDSVGYLSAAFTFSDEWVAPITAIFTSGEDSYSVILEENACNVPHEVINKYGFTVSCFCGSRITANTAPVNVIQSGYKDGQTPADPTQTVYEQLLEITKPPYIGENGNWYEWDAETKVFVDSGVYSTGDTGATPTISIGTVTDVGKDGTPSVEIDPLSTTENVILNIGLKTGATGATPQISIGTVTNVAPDGNPYVNVDATSTPEHIILNFGVKQGSQGIKGDTGATPNISINSVVNLPYDDTPYVELDATSTPEAPKFNFGLIKGQNGTGVAEGGTDGQVLVKDGASNYNTKWIDIIDDEKLKRNFSPSVKTTATGTVADNASTATLQHAEKSPITKIEIEGNLAIAGLTPTPESPVYYDNVSATSTITGKDIDGADVLLELPYEMNAGYTAAGVREAVDTYTFDMENETYQHVKNVVKLEINTTNVNYAAALTLHNENDDTVVIKLETYGTAYRKGNTGSPRCSHFVTRDNVLSQNTTVNGVYGSPTGTTFYFRILKTTSYMDGETPVYVTDLATAKAWFTAQNTAGTPVTLWYKAYTPVTTDITDAEFIADLKSLYTSDTTDYTLVASDETEALDYTPPSLLEVTYSYNRQSELEQSNAYLNTYVDERLNNHTVNYEISKGTSIETFSDIADWTISSSAGSIETNIKQYKTGSKSIKLITNSDAQFLMRKDIASTDFSGTNLMFSLWVYLHNVRTDYSSLDLLLYTDTNNYYYRAKYPNKLYNGWNMLTFNGTGFPYVGSPSWSNINTIGIRLTAASGKTCSASIDDLRVGKAWQPKIIFRFDDGLNGVYDYAYPIMSAKGMSGITYINSDRVDASNPTVCTLAELQEMYADGWDIGNHTDNHVNLDILTYAQTVESVKDCQDWLIQNGFYKSARHFCVPEGKDTEYLQQAFKDVGMLTSTNSIHDSFTPNMNLFKIPEYPVYNTTTPAQVIAYIDSAIASGRTTVLMFHDIVNSETPTEYEYKSTDFQTIVDYIYNNDLTKYVVTMSEFYEGLNRHTQWDGEK